MKMPPLPEEKPAVKRSRWLPPENARSFFSPAADFEFKQAHPVGYFFLVLLDVDAFETQRRSLLLSGGSFKTEWPNEGTDYLLWKGRISCQGIKNFPTVEVLGDELTMIDPMDEG